MLGSDYPFPLGEQTVGELVRTASSLTEAERRLVLGGNASSFFGLADKLFEARAEQAVDAADAQLAAAARTHTLPPPDAVPLHLADVLHRLRQPASGIRLDPGGLASGHPSIVRPLLSTAKRPASLPPQQPTAKRATPPPLLNLHLPSPAGLPSMKASAQYTPPVAHAAAGRSRVPVRSPSSLLSIGMPSLASSSSSTSAITARGVHSRGASRAGQTALTRRGGPRATPYTPPVAHAAAGLGRVPVRGLAGLGLGRSRVRTYAMTPAYVVRQRLLTLAPYAGAAPVDAFVAAEPLHDVLNHIDGVPTAAAGGSTMPLIDATSGRVRGTVAASSASDVQAAVGAAARALERGEWASTPMAARAAVLVRAAELLEANAEAFAHAEAADVGKPVALARALDVPRAAANLRMFAGLVQHGDLASVRHGGGGDRGGGLDDALNYTVRKPVGVVGLVTPWNLPLYLLTWKLAPALAMGNSIVAKPSELTPSTASMLAPLLEQAGLPPGVFNVVHGSGADAGAALCTHPQVGAALLHRTDCH